MQVAVDGLAISTDGKTLHFQPLTGRLRYRIAIEPLTSDDPETAGRMVERAGASGVAGGLPTTRDGQLLITSPEDSPVEFWEGDRPRTKDTAATLPTKLYRLLKSVVGRYAIPPGRSAADSHPDVVG